MNVNYAGIDFKICSVPVWRTEAVYSQDGVDFLYYEINMKCTAWLNQDATRVFPGPTIGFNDLGTGVDMPPALTNESTWLSIVHTLSTPRQKLWVYEPFGAVDGRNPTVGQQNNVTLLISPWPGCTVDAKTGPICKVIDLHLDHGNYSMVMDMEFTNLVASVQSFSDFDDSHKQQKETSDRV